MAASQRWVVLPSTLATACRRHIVLSECESPLVCFRLLYAVALHDRYAYFDETLPLPLS